MSEIKKILVRTPNWVGDLVMSYAFFVELQERFPKAQIDVVIKQNLKDLLFFFPMVEKHYPFSKSDYSGPMGLRRFGKGIAQKQSYDLFICLPDSFSSALMAYFTKSKARIGYAYEARSFLLSKAYPFPATSTNQHRVEKYIHLLDSYVDSDFPSKSKNSNTRSNLFPKKAIPVSQSYQASEFTHQIVLNIQSMAASMTLPLEESVRLIRMLGENIHARLVLTGTQAIRPQLEEVCKTLSYPNYLVNWAGETSLLELAKVIDDSDLVISVDSGPAHLANSLGCPTIVLLGAGDPEETRPFEDKYSFLFKNDSLHCVPCKSNTCRYGTVDCLKTLNWMEILYQTKEILSPSN